jgi:hypothetical protein
MYEPGDYIKAEFKDDQTGDRELRQHQGPPYTSIVQTRLKETLWHSC